ncbi:TM2 domain-containing protein [Marinilactibacillus kalidii]|uniref:TM2 domain-containing protein n=1 Tax=Marinilactibacillus kalidii TaxID=2820274 RepID=UPI001ABE4A09|nr:TM2 domain-containing protein [Marinilactibacillus kalidii]
MYNQLTNEEKMVVNSEVNNQKKSAGVAYLLWFFLGTLGIHRFYLNRKASAIAQLLLTVVGWLTVVFAIGFVFLLICGVWLLVDLFLIGGMIKKDQADLVDHYSEKILHNRQASF